MQQKSVQGGVPKRKMRMGILRSNIQIEISTPPPLAFLYVCVCVFACEKRNRVN